MDSERVDAAFELTDKCCVDHAVALEPALPAEHLRHNIHPEMSLPALPMPGVSRVLGGFVHHVEPYGGESLGQRLRDEIAPCHGVKREPDPSVNAGHGEKTRELCEQVKAEAAASLRVSLPPGNDISAHAVAKAMYSNDQFDPAIRLTAVRLALPYEMPRLKAVDPRLADGPDRGSDHGAIRGYSCACTINSLKRL